MSRIYFANNGRKLPAGPDIKTTIRVVAFTEDGKCRELLMDDTQRLAVHLMIRDMFKGRKIPVSSEPLPLESL